MKIENISEFYRQYEESNKYYLAECRKCGWWGSSELLNGGHQLADTGDYDDVYCPICGNNDIYDKFLISK